MILDKAKSAQYQLRRSILKKGLSFNRFVMQAIILRLKAFKEKTALLNARELYEDSYLSNTDPLISITIATYNRGELLTERTLPSVFSQTYDHFEVVVVGDGCTDNTDSLLKSVNDSRLRFINLPQRGRYPTNPAHRHMVAGVFPMLEAQRQARGLWIAHLDDDEVWAEDHLHNLLRFAQARNLEFVSSHSNIETRPGVWELMCNQPFAFKGGKSIHHSSVMFRSYLTLFKMHISSWRYELGADWHCFMRMSYAGVRDGVLERVTVSAPLRPGTTRPWAKAEDRL